MHACAGHGGDSRIHYVGANPDTSCISIPQSFKVQEIRQMAISILLIPTDLSYMHLAPSTLCRSCALMGPSKRLKGTREGGEESKLAFCSFHFSQLQEANLASCLSILRCPLVVRGGNEHANDSSWLEAKSRLLLFNGRQRNTAELQE